METPAEKTGGGLTAPVEIIRPLFRGSDTQQLAPGGGALFKDHAALGDAKKLGQVSHEMFIGPAIDRWRGEPYLEMTAHHPGHGIAAGPRLNLYLKNEVRTFLAEPSHV